MKFYIASSLKNYQQVRDLSRLLTNGGWEHTYDWTLHCPVKEIDAGTLKSIGEKEYEGIKQSDVVIILTPQGRGTHTEFGIAIALNKKVYLCHNDDTYFKCDDNTSAFYWLPYVNQLIGNTEEIASELLKLQ
jgi:nucleoside 2-deoxyribosyltransferase